MYEGRTDVEKGKVLGHENLCELIKTGKVDASFFVSHELPLDKAPDAYKHFDQRDKGWSKVVLKPAAAQGRKSRKAAAAKR